ncbi:MAG TPA: UvrB/UvrC motif-containing protein [Clostridiales bacterium]|nr:UvrB/UvrC motif-containing protein [Clostridiales bacterium]
MLCQNCGKNEATTHIKKITNGERVSLHLCHNCAVHLGYTDLLSGIGANLGSFLQSFFPLTAPETEEEQHCPTCGFTFRDIVRTGMMGCADCYTTFYDKLRPSLTRIHGRASHVGKTAATVEQGAYRQEKIATLKKQMEEAIQTQDFEQAAKIRDELNMLGGGKTV